MTFEGLNEEGVDKKGNLFCTVRRGSSLGCWCKNSYNFLWMVLDG